MSEYAPLAFLNESIRRNKSCYSEGECITEFNGNSWEKFSDDLFKNLLGLTKHQKPDKEWFIKYMLNPEFLDHIEEHKNEYMSSDRAYNLISDFGMDHYLDVEIFKTAPFIFHSLGYNIKDFENYLTGNSRIKDIKSELRDAIIATFILDEWVCNKQVLKPDGTFAKYLLDTDRLKISEDFFEHLPYNTFYVDLEDAAKHKNFGDVCGVFVNIRKLDKNRVALTSYVLSNELLIFSHYMIFDMNNIETIEIEDFDEEMIFDQIPALDKIKSNAGTTVNVRAVVTLVLQLICYMHVAKPDIELAPEMSHTYKPNKHGGRIMNKYNEVMKKDVGIKIGKTITNKIKEMKKAEEKQRKEIEKSNDKTRKPPTPHFRCAHWHKFWCGSEKDNTKRLELRWIEPIFVCGSYTSDSKTDVTIHAVK